MTVKHTIRTADGRTQEVELTRGKAIRLNCLECCNWQSREVRLCVCILCALYPYRMGSVSAGGRSYPDSTLEGTPDER